MHEIKLFIYFNFYILLYITIHLSMYLSIGLFLFCPQLAS